MITFGVLNKNGAHYKLCVNPKTKEFETGQCLVNSCYVDIWLKTRKDIDKLALELKFEGYTPTDTDFKQCE